MNWINRLKLALGLLQQPKPHRAAIEPEAMAGPDWKDGDTLPFVHREAVSIPLSQIPVIPRHAPQQLRAVPGSRDNAMGDPWVPPGAGGYGAAASQVESGEAPAPAFKAGSGGSFGGGGADASWGSSSSDSGCSSGGDSGSSGGCGGGD